MVFELQHVHARQGNLLITPGAALGRGTWCVAFHTISLDLTASSLHSFFLGPTSLASATDQNMSECSLLHEITGKSFSSLT